MTSTVFTSGTVIVSPWLNDINAAIYTAIANSSGSPPTTTAQVVTNLSQAGGLATQNTTQTLTNKTLTNPTVTTGTFTSPALVTPALGTVASGVISACTSTSMVLTTPVIGAATGTSLVLSGLATIGTTLGVTGAITLSNTLIGSVQSLSGAGAVNLTTTITKFTSTGASQALTLANGTNGQIKTIVHFVDGGSGVLTPTNLGNGTTITFTNVGDSCILQFVDTDWWVFSLQGAVLA